MQFFPYQSEMSKISLQALRLEPYLVISNQTGIPLQLMQPRRGAVQQSFAGIAPSQATRDGLPRAGVPPAGRPSFGQGPPPQGLRSAISAQDADYTSTLDLPTGARSTAPSELSFFSGLTKSMCQSALCECLQRCCNVSYGCIINTLSESRKDTFKRC